MANVSCGAWRENTKGIQVTSNKQFTRKMYKWPKYKNVDVMNLASLIFFQNSFSYMKEMWMDFGFLSLIADLIKIISQPNFYLKGF